LEDDMTNAQQRGEITLLEGFPSDVVAARATGFIDRSDYEGTLIPVIESRIRENGKVKFLYVLGEDFAGFSAGAAWDDARLGLMHMGDFARIAVVSDKDWVRIGMKMFAPFVAAEIQVFAVRDLDAAKAWIVSNKPESRSGPGVAADYAIPPLEDKTPPVD
jgi:stage II sporulation SpoAA-like protein